MLLIWFDSLFKHQFANIPSGEDFVNGKELYL